jgi:cytochrome bd ubiquinol oxidase subunit I
MSLTLARLQFATTTGIHFLFVLLTLGLVTQLAFTQTRWAMTGQPVYERMTRYWGQLYVINYAVGIATGLVMEFQFGLNWSGLSRLTGDVFGAPLAMETLIAFFLESTLLGMWIFGWGRLSRGVQLVLIWGVAITAYLSAFWVMVANAFLQHPVGYRIDGSGQARLTDFGALLGNPNLWFALFHVIAAALVVGGFFTAGVSAWHFARRRARPAETPRAERRTDDSDWAVYRRSIRMGLRHAMIGSILVVGFGFAQFSYIDDTQPTKLTTGAKAAQAQANMVAHHGPGNYLPPDWVSGALGMMIAAGMLFFVVTIALHVLLAGDALIRWRVFRPVLWLLVVAIPIPMVVAITGWLVREGGRQPWAVYGLLKTADAVSGVSASTMLASFLGFGALVLGLAVTDWYLLARYARRKPGREFLPVPLEEAVPAW